MYNKESIVEYVNSLKSLINELFDVGYSISENEKPRSVLPGLHKDFAVAAKVIQMSKIAFTEAVSRVIIEESSQNET